MGNSNVFAKRSDEVEWFGIDWSKRLAGEDPLVVPDTIASSSWTVPDGLTSVAVMETDSVTGVKLSGGVHRQNYEVVNTIVTTTNTETLQTVIQVMVRD